MITIYNTKKCRKLIERIKKISEIWGKEKIIVGDDFNIRTGNLEGDKKKRGTERRSKDKKVGNRGCELMERMRESDLEILNGKTEGDREGEFTYIGPRGSTVIDYIFVNKNLIEEVVKFRLEERVESDHLLICVEVKQEEEKERREEEEREYKLEEREESREYICWDEEFKERYQRNTEIGGEEEDIEGETIEEKWEELKKIVKRALIYKKPRWKKEKIRYKPWQNKRCTLEKRKTKRRLKQKEKQD